MFFVFFFLSERGWFCVRVKEKKGGGWNRFKQPSHHFFKKRHPLRLNERLATGAVFFVAGMWLLQPHSCQPQLNTLHESIQGHGFIWNRLVTLCCKAQTSASLWGHRQDLVHSECSLAVGPLDKKAIQGRFMPAGITATKSSCFELLFWTIKSEFNTWKYCLAMFSFRNPSLLSVGSEYRQLCSADFKESYFQFKIFSWISRI